MNATTSECTIHTSSKPSIDPADPEQQPGDRLISLTEAAEMSPGRPSPSTCWRWCRKGVLTRAGVRVRLEHVRAGGRLFTTASSLRKFFAAVAASDLEHFAEPDPPGQSPTVATAADYLIQAGI